MVAASRGTVYLIAAQAVFVFLGFLLNAYLARSLSISDFGILGVAVTLSLTVATLLASGFSGATAKFVAEAPSKAASIQFYCERNLVKYSIVGAMAVLIFGYIFAGGFNEKFSVFALGAVIVFTQTFFNQRLSLRSAFKDFEKVAIGIASLGFTKLLLAFAFISSGLGALGAIAAHAFSPIVSFILTGRRKLENNAFFDEKKINDYALLYGLSAGVVLLVQNVDIFAVELLLKDSVVTGLYVSSTALSRAMVVLLGAIAVGIFPSISLLTSQKSAKTQNYLRTVFLYVFTLLIPIALFFSAGAYNLLSLFFSEKYVAATGFLQILSISAAFTTLIFISFAVFNAAGETRKTLKLALVFLVIETVAILLGFTIFGYSASVLAYSVLATTVIAFVITAFALRSEFGEVLPAKQLVKLIAAGLASTVVFIIVQSLLLSKWMLIPATVAGLFVYAVLIGVLKVYSKEDVRLVNGFVSKAFQPALLEIERLFGYNV